MYDRFCSYAIINSAKLVAHMGGKLKLHRLPVRKWQFQPHTYMSQIGCIVKPPAKGCEETMTIATNELSMPFYEQVLDFLATGPSAQEIVRFRPSVAAQQRFSELLELNRRRTLTLEETEELDHYVRIDRMVSLLKAKAYSHMEVS